MRKSLSTRRVCLVLISLGLPLVVLAQGSSPATQASSETDRLFTAFIEDATIVPQQWWEGQFRYADGFGENDTIDIVALQGIAAFQPIDDFEFGGRVGFGDSDIEGSSADGSGATDLDLWAKYHLGSSSERTEWVVGSVLTVPTGDDAAGLGLDAFAASGFGAMRHRLDRVIVTAHAGLQLNGDGRVPGAGSADLDGEVAPQFGAGVIVPFSDRVSLVGEGTYRGERLDGFDADARILGGINWRVANRGLIRSSLAVGIADGSPDFEFTVGYAASF